MSGSEGYAAATEAAAFQDRSRRRRLEVGGRAPVRMLDGMVTASIPAGARPVRPGVLAGRCAYAAVLTAKGRMISDLRIFRTDRGGAVDRPAAGPVGGPATLPGAEGEQGLLLDVPEAGAPGLLAHFGRFLPPRFARVDDVSDVTGLVTVVGPAAADLLSRDALGLRVESHELEALAEGEYRSVTAGSGEQAWWDRTTVVRVGDLAASAFDVLADARTVRALIRRLGEAGVPPLPGEAWETLRIEAGRPAFGVDMDAETLPVEAGIQERAIDYGKGCYTGQEVIVRIRDRGHVNRHLRGILPPSGDPPPPGTELFAPEVRASRPVGSVTSSVRSPRAGRALALGWVRREVAPGASVRIGSGEGPEAEVRALDPGWWS